MLSNEDKNEIIEMLRCPTCGGKKIADKMLTNNFRFRGVCFTCNGTGIRLPEKDTPQVTHQVSEQEEKSCGNCKWTDIPNEWEPCVTCISARPSIKNKHWQPIEQSEDSQIDLLAKYIFQNYLEEITEGGAGEVAIKIIEKLQNSLSEKDKEIEELKAERDKFKFDVAYWQGQALQQQVKPKNYRVIADTKTEALGEG